MKRINIIIITLILSIIFMGIQVVTIMSASKFEPEISVVYAAVDIPCKTKIEDSMLKM